MENINKKGSLILIIVGLLILFSALIIKPLTLMNIFFMCFAIYFISVGILKKGHEDTLAIIIGISLLIFTIIWTIIKNMSIISYPNILYLITSLLFIIGGILGLLGYIPKWFYKQNL
jgi:hypothetical protein